jgi:hypothetical protein
MRLLERVFLLTLLAGAVAELARRWPEITGRSARPAFSPDLTDPNLTQRPAGPRSMRDPVDHWDDVDEASDQSFPASDPPARY